MLDTKFPRPYGDMGNAGTWPFPVIYKKVKSASVPKVVKDCDTSLIPLFVEAAKELEEQGVQAITTNCGFLALFQKEIQSELNVPFYSSNLMQIPLVYSIVGQKGQIGVLTVSKETLTPYHFECVGVKDIPLAIEGMDEMDEFTSTIVYGKEEMDLDKMEREVVQQARALVENNPNIRAIVLECTNLTPYIDSIKKATNLPVFDIVSFTEYIYRALP